MRARRELLLFGASYLLYNAGRALIGIGFLVACRPRVLRPQAVFA
jgi:hypothetical protein